MDERLLRSFFFLSCLIYLGLSRSNISGCPFLKTILPLHMLQLSRFARESLVFLVSIPYCRTNTKSPAEIKS